jgi:hypothetical protein
MIHPRPPSGSASAAAGAASKALAATSTSSSAASYPTQQQQRPSPERILEALSRPAGDDNSDAHYVIRLMHSIGEEVAVRALAAQQRQTSKQEVDSSSAASFAVAVMQSPRFFDLVATHLGGELDGWGAATSLVCVTVQALVTVVLAHPKAAWFFLVLCGDKKKQSASRVLNRVIALASACPSTVVNEMSSASSTAGVGTAAANTTTQHSLQTEGEIIGWYTAWEFICGLIAMCGTEARKDVRRRSEDLGRQKAMRQSAAVLVAYLKNESKAVLGTKNPLSPNRVMLSISREYVESG